MDKNKILLWAPLGSGKHYWGPGISAYNLYKQLDKSKYELHLAHGYIEQGDDCLFDTQNLICPLQFKSYLSQIKFLLKSWKYLKKNAHKFDVIHVLSPHHIGFLPALWFEKYNKKGKAFVKFTAKNDGFNDNSKMSKLLRLKETRLKITKKIAGVIAISSEIVEELIQVGVPKDRINFIPNGVNTERFKKIDDKQRSELRRKLGISNRFTVIFTGGLSKRKGPSLIVEAVEILIKNNKKLNLLIIGPDRDGGVEKQKIDKILANNPALVDYVRLIGHVNNPEYYYSVSDVFVLPSLNEGMSNSLLEALSSGLPSIVTNISGSNDLIVDGENGFFVKRNSQDIAKKIETLMTKRNLLEIQAVKCRETVKNNYSDKKVLESHLKLFFD